MNISFQNIETLLEKLQPKDTIVLNNIHWVEPIGIALLKLYKIANPNTKILYSGNPNATNYIKTLLHTNNTQHINYLPLIQFDNNIDTITDIITRKIIYKAKKITPEAREDLLNYLKYLIREIMDNVISHSQSNCGGFITAQLYPSNNKVQVVIIDNGIGLLHSLSNHYNLENETAAIKKAMEKEVTGSNSFAAYNNVQKHAGLGLFFLSRIIENTKGNLLIVSNNTIYKTSQNTFKELNTDFKGTLIAFEIFEDNLEYEFIQLFNIIKAEDEEEEEDIF